MLVDGTFWLTYRVRRPLTDGRGVAVVVARSDDGVRFEDVAQVRREEFGCESFERPVLVPVPRPVLVPGRPRPVRVPHRVGRVPPPAPVVPAPVRVAPVRRPAPAVPARLPVPEAPVPTRG